MMRNLGKHSYISLSAITIQAMSSVETKEIKVKLST